MLCFSSFGFRLATKATLRRAWAWCAFSGVVLVKSTFCIVWCCARSWSICATLLEVICATLIGLGGFVGALFVLLVVWVIKELVANVTS